MKRDFSFSPLSGFFAGLVFLLLSFTPVAAQELSIPANDVYTVEDDGSPEEYTKVTINQNSHLIVEGTLIVFGNLDMQANDSQITFKDGSVVIVYGNFIAGNKVSISAHSHFIVYGDFIRQQGNTQHAGVDFTNGNIYIFGDVDDSFNIDDCDIGNDGDAKDDGSCEYRTEEDFKEDELDPELQEALNCYKIHDIQNVTACENQSAIFAAVFIASAPETVVYQWQKKQEGGIWENLDGETGLTLTVDNIDISMDGAEYRLVLSGGTCDVSISNTATLEVTGPVVIGEITGLTEVCGKGPFTYTLAEAQAATDYSWQVPSGWTFEEISDSEISVTPGTVSGEIKVTGPGSCGDTMERVLWVEPKVPGMWNGSVSSLWEDPNNWECRLVPTLLTDVTIPSDAAIFPAINEEVTATTKNILIEAGASLEVLGDLQISGLISATENLNAQGGTVSLTGESAQIIPGNVFLGNRVNHFNIDNPAGVSISNSLEIKGVLTVVQGDLYTNANLTLISDVNGTALVSGTGTGNIVGAITLQRYLDPSFGYKYFSSPLKGTTVTDFDPFMELQDSTGFPHFYRYDENREDVDNNDLTGWEAYIDPSLPINVMEGYALNFGTAGGAVTVSLSGEVNNGPLTRTLTNNNGTYTKGFNLVGNPYPSPIDWNQAAGWTKTNIDDAVYFFSASSTDSYTGTYSSHIENISSDGKTTGIIPSMQGFFVHVTDGSTQGTLEINNQARVDDQVQEFHKTLEDRIPLLRISAGFEKESLSDPTVIYFSPTAEASYDSSLDALKLMNTNPEVPSFYSLTPEKEELSINALPLPLQKDLVRIPIGYKALKAGKLEIALQDLENLPLDLQVYLVDLEKQVYIDLQQEKAYTTTVSKGSSDNRFELVLLKESITDPAKLLNIPMSVYATKEKVSVSLNLETGEQAEIQITSLSGQVLKSLKVSSQETVEIKGIRSAGVYIISLVSGETRYSKKILIK